MIRSESEATTRVAEYARLWGVAVSEHIETATSAIAFGVRDRDAVILKVLKTQCDEWNAGRVLEAFDGRGMVCVLQWVPGAMLLERLEPGTPLVELCATGRDEEATNIIADVVAAMPDDVTDSQTPTVADWGGAFARYAESNDRSLPSHLVERAREMFDHLEQTQSRQVLLHGDLQHYNVLFDDRRGWIAIDPKGVIGEREYEVGAMLRNPATDPDLFCSVATVERRIAQFETRLGIDPDRTLRWAFAQAVLSAIWSIEDGDPPQYRALPMRLAEVLLPIVR